MIRSKRVRPVLVIAVATATTAALLPTLPAAAHSDKPTVRVVADGLFNPRSLVVTEQGGVFVAEAGRGGSLAIKALGQGGGPPTTMCFGRTGAITMIGKGAPRRLVSDLPSYTGPATDGSCDPAVIGQASTGAHDVAVTEDGSLTVTIGLGGTPDARALAATTAPFASQFATLLRIPVDGKRKTVADLAAFEGANDPDGGGVDSNPYSVTPLRKGALLAVDAGGNDLVKVSRGGQVSTVAVFPTELRRVPQLSCPPPPGFPPAGTPIPSQAVPTSVTVGPDGAYYVGQLTGFPFEPGTAKVFRVDPKTGQVSTYASGFTNIVSLAFGPDRSLYVLEIARDGLLEAEVCGRAAEGRLVQVKRGVQREIPVPGLILPGGVAVSERGTIYVSNRSIQPGGVGEILRINLSDRHGND